MSRSISPVISSSCATSSLGLHDLYPGAGMLRARCVYSLYGHRHRHLRRLGTQDPIVWVSYVPLLPLALFLSTGLHLFALPYATKWRSRRRTD